MTRRQKPSVGPDRDARITSRAQLKRMAQMCREVARAHSLRWLARYTRRGYGWWDHVAHERFTIIKPTLDDYVAVKRVHDILKDGARIDAETMAATLEFMEAWATAQAKAARVLALVRKRARN